METKYIIVAKIGRNSMEIGKKHNTIEECKEEAKKLIKFYDSITIYELPERKKIETITE